jgi:hexosaminidase
MVIARSFASIVLLASSVLAVWPLPTKYSHGDEVLWIAREKVTVSYHGPTVSPLHFLQAERLLTPLEQTAPGYGSTSGNTTYGNEIVANAIERTFKTLFEQNFIPWKFRPRLSDFEPEEGADATYISSITLTQTTADSSDLLKPTTDLDESYTLEVKANGQVNVSAKTSIGLLYGLTTFSQLFYKHSSGDVYTPLAPVSITDSPKFKWRGLNVDTSRSYKPMKDLYRTIDALSYNKMNRLHWHVTDSQSWPLEIDSMPEVANKGVYVKWQRYTKENVKALQHYGALLGVEVALEIDNPGHTASIAFSHPDLIAAFNVQPKWTDYCAQPPCGTLKLNSTKVYNFLEKMLDDLLPRLKPLTSYFHLGGDEVNMNAYTLDDTVGSNDSAVLQPLMQKYMDRNMKQVESYGLVPLVWEEMLLTWNLTLPKNTIVQTWQSDEAVAQVVSKGYRALAGNYNFCE